MVRAALVLLLAIGLAAQDERKALARLLGEDPFVPLAAIGAQKTEAARTRASGFAAHLDSRMLLRVIRVGLASDEERVLFGATMLLGDYGVVAPELRRAAARVIPRVGDADCPVTMSEARMLWGSVDVPAVIARIPALPPTDADYCLGELHRIVRAEHVPTLCELALATTGEVQRGAFEDATLTSRFSGEHGPLVITTWAKCSGVRFDEASGGERLPGDLRAALAWVLDNPPPTTKEAIEADKTLRPRHVLVARWLMASRAGAQDLPLLRRLIDDGWFRSQALVALGHLRDAESLAVLREHAVGEDRSYQRSAQMALACRGDAAALDTLLAGPCDSLACGLAVASPERRRAFAAHVIALPVADSLRALLGAQRALTDVFPTDIPPVDETWLAEFEPLAAAAKDLDVRVLATLVAVVPACATARLADRLLAHPASELFANGGYSEWPWLPRGDLAFRGVWPFLEVTRPEPFRTRLREGLATGDDAVQKTCADLLLRLADRDSAKALLAWVQRTSEDRWFELAAIGGDDVRAALLARALEAGDARDRGDALRALARLHGMPDAAARSWRIPADDMGIVTDALRRRDAGAAFIATARNSDGSESDLDASALLPWRDDRIEALVRSADERAQRNLLQEQAWQFEVGLQRADATMRGMPRELSVDGRYVTHQFLGYHLADRDLTMLSFWIDELGANCCRRVVADEALEAMFGEEPEHGDDDNEPVTSRLRRRLLPLQDRLRWSKLANGYVVAGN